METYSQRGNLYFGLCQLRNDRNGGECTDLSFKWPRI